MPDDYSVRASWSYGRVEILGIWALFPPRRVV